MGRKSSIFIPKERDRCCGKNRYQDRREAEQIAEEQMIMTSGLTLSTYACTCGCGGWHLTRNQDENTSFEQTI